MLKRITALLLSVSLCAPILNVWAAGENSIIVTDDFNSAKITVQASKYIGNVNSYSSDVMYITRDSSGRSLHSTTIDITEEGYEGKALLVAPVSTEVDGVVTTEENRIPGRTFELGDKLNEAEANYRFTIRNAGVGDDEAVRMYCGFSTVDGYSTYKGITIYKDRFILGDNAVSFPYEVGAWYSVKYIVNKDNAQIFLMTATGEPLAEVTIPGEYKDITIAFNNPKNAVKDFALVLDDTSVARYSTIENETPFTDITTMHWAYEYVAGLYKKQVVDGVSETTFAPGNTISREEFVKMAVGTAIGEPAEGEALAFDDVDANAWYAPYISAALGMGLSVSASDKHFGIGENITREEVIVILDQILTYSGLEYVLQDALAFTDKAKISADAVSAVGRVVAAGLINGDEKNRINPQGKLTRAEVCAIISRLDALINPEEKVKDRLDKSMPPQFDPLSYDRELLAVIDFENGNTASVPNAYSSSSYKSDRLDSTGGYESQTSYKLNPVSGGNTIGITVTGLDLKAGDTILGVGYMRSEGLSSAATRSGGSTWRIGGRSNMSYSNSKTGESASIYQIYESIINDTDWIPTKQCIELETDADKVTFNCYLSSVDEGTAWVDNIAIYKIALDPFIEAVLETPNYKGLIYGEGGEGDINLSTSVKDYSIYNLDECEVNAKIVDEDDNVIMQSNLKDIQQELRFSFSSKHLQMNQDYYLQLTLDNVVTGEQEGFREFVLRKRPEDFRPNNYFNEHGQYVIDGKPTFMMGMYGMNQLYETIKDFSGTPVNVLLPYGYAWFNIKKNESGEIVTSADRALLDYAEENGVKMLISLTSFSYDKAQSGDNASRRKVFDSPEREREIYTKLAESLDHPAFLGFYLADEQSVARYGPHNEWRTRLFSSLDLNDFTFNTFSLNYNRRTQFRYADTTNCSWYGVNGFGDEDPSRVTKVLKPTFEVLPENNRPIYCVIQSAQISATAKRAPNAEEMRNTSMQCICMGAQGILWYNYFEMKREEGPAWQEFEDVWPEFIGVLEEIESYYPMILSTEAAPVVEAEAADWLSYIPKRYDGKTYLFSVNTSRSIQNARFKLEGATKVTGLHSGKTYEIGDDGWFEVEYPAIGVEVFEIEQKDYLSPEHQMSAIGFFDGKTSFVLTDDDDMHSKEWSITVPASLETLEYAATISDNAKLYINDELVPASGSISISGVNTLRVKVEAEDSRYSTEYTYKIVR